MYSIGKSHTGHTIEAALTFLLFLLPLQHTSTLSPSFYVVSDLSNVISVFNDISSVPSALAFPCRHMEEQGFSRKEQKPPNILMKTGISFFDYNGPGRSFQTENLNSFMLLSIDIETFCLCLKFPHRKLTLNPEYLSVSGRFVAVDTIVNIEQNDEMSADAGTQREIIGILVSPTLDQGEWSCLRLIYQIIGSGNLEVLQRTEGKSFDRPLWSGQVPSDSWVISSMDLPNSTEPYKVTLFK